MNDPEYVINFVCHDTQTVGYIHEHI